MPMAVLWGFKMMARKFYGKQCSQLENAILVAIVHLKIIIFFYQQCICGCKQILADRERSMKKRQEGKINKRGGRQKEKET